MILDETMIAVGPHEGENCGHKLDLQPVQP